MANALARLARQFKSSRLDGRMHLRVRSIFSETIVTLLCLVNKVSLYSQKKKPLFVTGYQSSTISSINYAFLSCPVIGSLSFEFFYSYFSYFI